MWTVHLWDKYAPFLYWKALIVFLIPSVRLYIPFLGNNTNELLSSRETVLYVQHDRGNKYEKKSKIQGSNATKQFSQKVVNNYYFMKVTAREIMDKKLKIKLWFFVFIVKVNLHAQMRA